VNLRVEVPNMNLMLECRPTQISQIILNFLNNSFDAVGKLPEKWIEVSVEELTNEIKIQVTDSGAGIDKSLENKIGQPFFTTKEPGKGTGLGLSVSRGLAEKHEGKIYLDKNCPNTRFVLLVPKKQPLAKVAKTA
jgi:signal transduction histidine kinase